MSGDRYVPLRKHCQTLLLAGSPLCPQTWQPLTFILESSLRFQSVPVSGVALCGFSGRLAMLPCVVVVHSSVVVM